jgi:hypothetical protein
LFSKLVEEEVGDGEFGKFGTSKLFEGIVLVIDRVL